MKLTTARRSTIAQGILADMTNGTAASPKIQFYTGTMPASMGGAISDTLLAEFQTTTTVGTEAGGAVTLDAIADVLAIATGTVGWARTLDRDGAEANYLTVTATGGGGDIELNTVEIATGGTVSITSGTITVGGQ